MPRPERRAFATALSSLMLACLLCACGREPAAVLPGAASFEAVAVQFAVALSERRYGQAHALATQSFRAATSVEQMRAAFERIVPPSWDPVGPVEQGLTQTAWPGKQPGDLGWVYAGIGGKVYSEAVILIVAAEGKEAKVRSVEFGRP